MLTTEERFTNLTAVPSARLNVTWHGQNGEYPDPVDYAMDTQAVLRLCQESVASGYIPGITQDPECSFEDFVVDRFPATAELPDRLFVRPKTPVGAR